MSIPKWRKWGFKATMWLDRTGLPVMYEVVFWAAMIVLIIAVLDAISYS